VSNVVTEDELAQLEHCFKYHAPTPEQAGKYVEIRDAAKAFALVVTMCCLPSADRTAAFRQIQDAVMTANRSIALGGKGMR
jgi:hypothetical protein